MRSAKIDNTLFVVVVVVAAVVFSTIKMIRIWIVLQISLLAIFLFLSNNKLNISFCFLQLEINII